MSDFEKYWEENASKESWANKAVAWSIWKEKQAIIDNLRSQLNNMEACYIGKKKRVELLESNINNLAKQFSDCYETAYAEYKKNADSYYSGKCDAFDLAEQLAGLALRGEHE